MRTLVLHASPPGSETLSYQHGWPRALAVDANFDTEVVDVRAMGALGRRLRGFDAIVLLHSVFSNERLLSHELARRIRRSAAHCVLFLGNEYKLMPEKLAFAEELGVDLLVSQLEVEEAHALYRARLGCAVVGIPNAGLDPEAFRPVTPFAERPIEIGYRAYENPWYLGHRERRLLVNAFTSAVPQPGLRLDVSLDPALRMGVREWASFLDQCVGQLGSEAGGDFFELDDRTRRAVNEYQEEHPDASFEEIFDRFFRMYDRPISGRCISSRVVEAAATRTAQLLIEGRYSGYLDPQVHYIPLRRDMSNIDDALAMFRDDSFRCEVVENAYQLAHEKFAFPQLIARLRTALETVR